MKRFTQMLSVKLSDAEIVEKAKAMSESLCHVRTLETEKSESMRHYKEQIDAENGIISDLAKCLRDGAEARQVECIEQLDVSTGHVLVVREDTGEVVSSRPATDADRQLALETA